MATASMVVFPLPAAPSTTTSGSVEVTAAAARSWAASSPRARASACTSGAPWATRTGQTTHCETSGKAIYGFGIAFGDLGGSQAEYVRVPLADGHLEHVPDGIDDESALFLSCNLPGAVTAVDSADIRPTDIVAMIGCGPTGQLALQLARTRTGCTILALDRVPGRLATARRLGARPVDVDNDDIAAVVADATDGRGVDKVIEFAGRGDAFNQAVSIARPGGVISGGGVYLEQDFPVSLFDMHFKNLQIRLNGFANAATAMWEAGRLITAGVIDPRTVVSHRVSLAEVPAAATAFAARQDGFNKMVISL